MPIKPREEKKLEIKKPARTPRKNPYVSALISIPEFISLSPDKQNEVAELLKKAFSLRDKTSSWTYFQNYHINLERLKQFTLSHGLDKTVLFMKFLVNSEFKNVALDPAALIVIFKSKPVDELKILLSAMNIFINAYRKLNLEANKLHPLFELIYSILRENKINNKLVIRMLNIIEGPMPLERLTEFYNYSIKERGQNIKQDPTDKTTAIYSDRKISRNISRAKFRIWKELFDSGLQVEPIVSYRKLGLKDLRTFRRGNENQYIVESKVVGVALMDIKIEKLPLVDRLSIARQMYLTLSQLWAKGYEHFHTHLGNWTLTYVQGQPKIYLIDFDLCKKNKVPDRDLYQFRRILHSLLPEYEDIYSKLLAKKRRELSKR